MRISLKLFPALVLLSGTVLGESNGFQVSSRRRLPSFAQIKLSLMQNGDLEGTPEDMKKLEDKIQRGKASQRVLKEQEHQLIQDRLHGIIKDLQTLTNLECWPQFRKMKNEHFVKVRFGLGKDEVGYVTFGFKWNIKHVLKQDTPFQLYIYHIFVRRKYRGNRIFPTFLAISVLHAQANKLPLDAVTLCAEQETENEFPPHLYYANKLEFCVDPKDEEMDKTFGLPSNPESAQLLTQWFRNDMKTTPKGMTDKMRKLAECYHQQAKAGWNKDWIVDNESLLMRLDVSREVTYPSWLKRAIHYLKSKKHIVKATKEL